MSAAAPGSSTPVSRPAKITREGIGYYAAAVLFSLAAVTIVLQLWGANLRIPFDYSASGDVYFTGMFVKGSLENGWYLQNPNLGMPFGGELLDYPISDNLHILVMKLIGSLAGDYAAGLNVYYLLTYPLSALTALYVFRQFNLSNPAAWVASVLFAFLPYHLLRAEGHLFLASYYLIPLAVMVVLWVCLGQSLHSGSRAGLSAPLDWLNRTTIAGILICLAVSAAGIYYAIFAAYLLVVAGAFAFFRNRRLDSIVGAAIFVLALAAGVVGNELPSILYAVQHGGYIDVVREPIDAELFGLRISQLLLPTPWHRVPFLAQAVESYYRALGNVSPRLVNESATSSLGWVAGLSFLFLIGWLLFKRASVAAADLPTALSVLNLSAVLLAITGGLGSLVALVFPLIRAYNRISVYIAFFALFAFAWAATQFARKWAKSTITRVMFAAGLGLVLIMGLLDQTPAIASGFYEQTAAEFASDHSFVKRIEAIVPTGAMVFQLPYVPFPEASTPGRMVDYDLFRGYLNSDSLRWSYGAMKDRPADDWQADVSAEPLDKQVETLAFAGFAGIYVDRFGYPDSAEALRKDLSTILGVKPIESDDQRLLFFPMTQYGQTLRRSYSDAGWQLMQDVALRQSFLSWSDGCWDAEGTIENNWHWCSSSGQLAIHNPSTKAESIALQMTVFSGYPEPAVLRIDGPDFSESVEINSSGTSFSKTLSIPHGTTVIRFSSNANRADAPGDPRNLVFRVANFSVAGAR